MANRGRPSNAERARRAEQAAKEAPEVAMEVPEIPEPPKEPEEKGIELEDKSPRLPRNEERRKAFEEIEQRDIHSKSAEWGLQTELGIEPKKEETETPQDLPPPTPESMLQGGKFSQPAPTVKQTVDGVD